MHVECNMKIMIKKINGFQKLEEAKEMYLKDSKKFKDLLNNCPGSCFQKIGTIDFVDDNENFKLISDLCDKHELNENVDIFEHIIHSAVEGNDGLFNVTISNSIAFVLQDGSLLRFLPSKGEGLVISRVLVTEINRSRGNGTALMNMFLMVILLSIKSFPDIELECTGNINSGIALSLETKLIWLFKSFFHDFEEDAKLNIITHAILLAMVDDDLSRNQKSIIKSFFDLLSPESAEKVQELIDSHAEYNFNVKEFVYNDKDDNVIKHRLATCTSCEYFTQLRRCKQCGCFMDAKTKLVIAKCPVNKW